MNPIRMAAPLALSALLVACLPVSKPIQEEEQPKEQETATDGAAQSFAGKWKREDTGAVFEVEDDGTTAKGKLVPGTYLWKDGDDAGKEIFSRYDFELARKGKKLEGKATFAFAGEEQTYESKWSVQLEGDTLSARIEELSFDDAGKVSERKAVDKTFGFEPSAPAAAAAAPAAGGYKLDLTTMVQAPGVVAIAEGASVGMKIRMETVAAGQTTAYELAIVAEEGDSWHVETDQSLSAYAAMSPDAKEMVMGLVVAKEGGKVTKAVLGKRGEAGKEIKVMAFTPTDAKAPEGEDASVEVPAGSFSAKLYTTEAAGSTYKSYVGVDGDVEGVLLKFEGPQGGKALKDVPSMETLSLGEDVEAKKCVYDNGEEMWTTLNPVVKALCGGLVRMKSSSVTMELKQVGRDAKPQLKW